MKSSIPQMARRTVAGVIILTALVFLGSYSLACDGEDVRQPNAQEIEGAVVAALQKIPATRQLTNDASAPTLPSTVMRQTAPPALMPTPAAMAAPHGESTPTPSAPDPAAAHTRVAVGFGHACALFPDGEVDCWGFWFEREDPELPGRFVSISAGQHHYCGVLTGGNVKCWGWVETGATAAPADPFASVSAGGEHTCALRSDGSAECWGLDEYGQASPPAGTFVLETGPESPDLEVELRQ